MADWSTSLSKTKRKIQIMIRFRYRNRRRANARPERGIGRGAKKSIPLSIESAEFTIEDVRSRTD